jgi:uncharacterized lipoprotein
MDRKMLRLHFVGALLAVLALGACSGERGLSCESSERYMGATTSPPVRVPDDLSPPNEAESLVIPPADETALSTSSDPSRCLEAPPEFFEANDND